MKSAQNDDEDRELIRRLHKAPARYVYYVDVSSMSAEDADAYLKKTKRKFKRKSDD